MRVDQTHDPDLRSWVESANIPASDFPLQNLPFGRFRAGAAADWRIGVAIGEQVLDLQRAGLADSNDMATLMQQAPAAWRALRQGLSEGLRADSSRQAQWQAALLPQSSVQMGLRGEIRGYTDFSTSIYHATTVGRQFRPDNPLLPNYKWVPIGYHGRVSSLAASGNSFHRPMGQIKAAIDEIPALGPSRRLDFELELGALIGPGNPLGQAVPIAAAETHVVGFVLLNDWSARDIQGWEYQPLGPFLSKNFATTLSPWIVTLDALRPFRQSFARPAGDPEPLSYLDSAENRASGAFEIGLEVWLLTAAMHAAGHPGERLMRSNYRDAYWTIAQLVAHHTVNGCNLQSGDLLGTGTLSGPAPDQGGSLLELTSGGQRPLRLSNGETRTFLEDGDTVILRAYCEREGFRRIGFRACRGTVLPARQ